MFNEKGKNFPIKVNILAMLCIAYVAVSVIFPSIKIEAVWWVMKWFLVYGAVVTVLLLLHRGSIPRMPIVIAVGGIQVFLISVAFFADGSGSPPPMSLLHVFVALLVASSIHNLWIFQQLLVWRASKS